MPVLPKDIPDVVTSYLASVTKQKYSNLARNRQFSTFANDFVDNPVVKKDTKRAVEYRMEYMNRGYNNTRAKSIDSPDAPNRGNVSQYGLINMAFQDTHYIVNKLEPAFTGGTEQEVNNYLDLHLVNMYDRFFEFQDDKLFQLPTAPNTTDPLFWSIPYWVTPEPGSTNTFGFRGANASGYSATGGIDRSTVVNAGHRNGVGRYAEITQMDFCKLAAEAVQKCRFKPYYGVQTARAKEVVPEERYKFYSDFDTWQSYQDIAYVSNDNIGEDQGKYRRGKIASDNVFMSQSWTWVPDKQDNGSEIPVIGAGYFYGLDLSTWEFHEYGDWFMKFEKDAIRLEDSHNMLISWMEAPFQLACRSARSNFVLTPQG